jgi:hypothetical protein
MNILCLTDFRGCQKPSSLYRASANSVSGSAQYGAAQHNRAWWRKEANRLGSDWRGPLCCGHGGLAELFVISHKSNSAADVRVREASVAFSFAVQHGADPEAIRLALCRDSRGRTNGPLGQALDLLAEWERGP